MGLCPSRQPLIPRDSVLQTCVYLPFCLVVSYTEELLPALTKENPYSFEEVHWKGVHLKLRRMLAILPLHPFNSF